MAGRETEDQESTLPFAGVEPIRPARARVTLTVASHPDPARVGDRVVVPHRPLAVSRVDGAFEAPGGRSTGALDTRWISRSPIIFTARKNGGVGVEHDPARVRLHLGDRLAAAEDQLDPAAVRRGTPVVINGAITLLLHRSTWPGPQHGVLDGLVGHSDAMVGLRDRIALAAASPLPVLVRGETGTGKELIARALHAHSSRAGRPFVAVNMGAVPAELAASALFGHEAGAYSGAGKARPGAFRAAHGGTLFLDEIGEAPAAVQTALLRVLEVGEITPLGRARPEAIDVRVIAATDADLDARVADGRFRPALLERLGALELRPAPLKDRREDIGRLLYHFLAASPAAHRLSGATTPGALWPPADVVARLTAYDWPRNVRELRNVAHEMATFSATGPFVPGPKLMAAIEPAEDVTAPEPPGRVDPETLSTADVRALLKRHRWRVSAAARELGLSQGGMYGLLRRHRVAIARDLDIEAFTAAYTAAGGDIRAMAERLEMSVRALTLRRRQLGIED